MIYLLLKRVWNEDNLSGEIISSACYQSSLMFTTIVAIMVHVDDHVVDKFIITLRENDYNLI
jgi:hypothetical protein